MTALIVGVMMYFADKTANNLFKKIRKSSSNVSFLKWHLSFALNPASIVSRNYFLPKEKAERT
ncbi:hypothetical protein [Streptococcus infantarius]|uniref:hypothetical protein n=1 Tax=Streptococcus infantarius TaxID=102684 RepID=UPI0022E4D3E2|nr:hypothetical protein [Streptococcus infantarius]